MKCIYFWKFFVLIDYFSENVFWLLIMDLDQDICILWFYLYSYKKNSALHIYTCILIYHKFSTIMFYWNAHAVVKWFGEESGGYQYLCFIELQSRNKVWVTFFGNTNCILVCIKCRIKITMWAPAFIVTNTLFL